MNNNNIWYLIFGKIVPVLLTLVFGVILGYNFYKESKLLGIIVYLITFFMFGTLFIHKFLLDDLEKTSETQPLMNGSKRILEDFLK